MRSPKKIINRDLRRALDDQVKRLQLLALATSQDFERLGQALQQTRELCADLAARLDRVERQVEQIESQSLTIEHSVEAI